MVSTHRTLARVLLIGLLGATSLVTAARAEAAPCSSAAANKCVVGTGALNARIDKALGSIIDSGWMDKGSIKVRTRFTIAPVGREPIVAIKMPAGNFVEATWTEKGYVDLKPILGEGSGGTMDVRYTLQPALDAEIYGIGVSYSAAQLINKVQGASFNYDSKASTTLAPWGLDPAQVQMPAPALDQSTLFALPFTDLGVSSGIATGRLSIQAKTTPTFRYQTKELGFGPSVVQEKGGSARVVVGDMDALEVSAVVRGEITYSGTLDVRPVVQVDTVSGYPTFGLAKFSFSTVTKDYAGAPMPVSTETVTLHIPLPNVKVPKAPLSFGDVKAGGRAEKTVTIDNTGEHEGVFTITSSDPQFKVPAGEIKIAPKGKAPVKISFESANAGSASATITVKSNDPDSPEQTFRTGANGADLGPEEGEDDGHSDGRVESYDMGVPEASGCSVVAHRGPTTSSGAVAAGLALGLSFLARGARRRRG